MKIDVNCLAAVREELSGQIQGGKIDKIQQPESDLIILTLRGTPGQACKLLISAGSGDARVHLTDFKFDNPKAPPMFCMLLRKHLTGAKIINIIQPPAERILELVLLTSSAVGEKSEKRLVVELFGRKPNIILIDNDGIIIDCLRRIGGDLSDKRLLLPGLLYIPPAERAPRENTPAESTTVQNKHNESISKALDGFYTRKTQQERLRNRSSAILRMMKTAHKRIVRKLIAQKSELEETSKRELLRECGDIITANIHLIKKGQFVLIADDFFSEDGKKREIQLDPRKTAQQNAAKYYKAYSKAKKAVNYLTEQINKGEAELIYINSVTEQIERAENDLDIDEIRNELSQTGYIRAQKQANQKKKLKQKESLPHRFTSSTGMQIFAGRNNTQNDKLTLKLSSRADTWLHAQKIHGAHVVIKTTEKPPDETTLKEAASIAAYYSAARNDLKVPVDHTLVKYVKKPSGGRPGMVIYTNFQTITATPDEDLIGRLRG